MQAKAQPSPNQQAEEPKELLNGVATLGKAVRRVHQDREVTQGAFRFYYLLAYQYADETGHCWPGQRALQKAMHCSTRSLGAWTVLLCDRKHLSTKKTRTRYGLARLYTFWGVVPEVNTPGVSTLSGGAFTSGNETDYYKHRTINQGGSPGGLAYSVLKDSLTPAGTVSLQKELERLEARLQAIRNGASEVAGGGILYTEEQKQERKRLLARKQEIKELLGWLA